MLLPSLKRTGSCSSSQLDSSLDVLIAINRPQRNKSLVSLS